MKFNQIIRWSEAFCKNPLSFILTLSLALSSVFGINTDGSMARLHSFWGEHFSPPSPYTIQLPRIALQLIILYHICFQPHYASPRSVRAIVSSFVISNSSGEAKLPCFLSLHYSLPAVNLPLALAKVVATSPLAIVTACAH